MKHYLSIFFLFSITLLPVGTHSAPAQRQLEEGYFSKDSHNKMTEIASPGKTVIVGKSGNRSAKVIITSRKRHAWKSPDEEASLHEPSRAYEYHVKIFVDDEGLFVPKSAFSEFNDLNRGRIIIKDKETVLVLDGGDASEAYYVIINMDLKRVIRKRIYADCCDPKYLLEETEYHHVDI